MKHFHILFYRFTGEFVPIIPLLGLLFADSGLSISTLTIIFLTLSTTVFIFEIPTGILADRINPKLVLVFSRSFKLLSFTVIFLFNSLSGFVLGAFLWGISSALDSGAFQSYLFRFSRQSGNLAGFEKVYSKAMTAGMFALLMSVILTTQVELLGFRGLQMIGLASLALSVLSAILLPRVLPVTQEHESSPETLMHVFQYISQTPAIVLFLAVGILAGGFKGSLDEYTALVFVEQGAPLFAVGYMLFSLEILRSSGAFLSQWIRVSSRQQTVLLFLFGVCFAGVGYFENYILALCGIALIIVLDAVLWIHNDSAIQRLATDGNRATLASYKNFGTELLAMAIFLCIWLAGDSVSISSLYLYLGILLAIVSIALMLSNRLANKVIDRF